MIIFDKILFSKYKSIYNISVRLNNRRTRDGEIREPENRHNISFNNTDSFTHTVTLNTDNYNSWKTKMLYLLDINNLVDYVITKKIKKIK
ncbi:hypothetical protein BCR32DRAFT_284198 [Anaeromyces robustus]|uniref:Uncharacterized protein n=1 Tax=Anaeromyces robustus TaxID=1754192 RepID=A0A1Y1WSC2_9FUNG|nr:hypothetical protein BCR32DRAFT_284198 [Anaeromyces robustus]|eukprot:ORX76427.1 hypothetical protein BCR32DRAFT_284198 [Anaeromyces robustus]